MINKQASIEKAIKEEVARRDLQAQHDAEALKQLEKENRGKARAEEASRKMKQANYNVLKEAYKDPVQRKLQTMKVLGDMHNTMSFNNLKMPPTMNDPPKDLIRTVSVLV